MKTEAEWRRYLMGRVYDHWDGMFANKHGKLDARWSACPKSNTERLRWLAGNILNYLVQAKWPDYRVHAERNANDEFTGLLVGAGDVLTPIGVEFTDHRVIFVDTDGKRHSAYFNVTGHRVVNTLIDLLAKILARGAMEEEAAAAA